METIPISIKGKPHQVPAVQIGSRSVVLDSGLLRTARIHGDVWLEGQPVEDPVAFISAVSECSLKADIVTFGQAIPLTKAQYAYHTEWENIAVASTADYAAWWSGLPQATRKNVRRAERRGVVTRIASFDNSLVQGIKEIYDETPFRQGRPFWHYGKDLERVRTENASYLDRSEFIGAYVGDELVGFIKFVCQDSTARIMQIIAKDAHADKRVMNALLAKAMSVCHDGGITNLIYGQFIYNDKTDCPMTEFKKRNGFNQVLLPRYYIPLTMKGRLGLALRLHRGIKRFLPSGVVSRLLRLRAQFYSRSSAGGRGASGTIRSSKV